MATGLSSQLPNSIVLNASGSNLQTLATFIGQPVNSLYIKPIVASGGVIGDPTCLCYEPVSGIVYTSNAPGSSKKFTIQHPLHENKYLSHACLEGPEDVVYYIGEGKIENKSVEISLPDYVDALAHNFTVQLTQKFDDNDTTILRASPVVDGKFMVYGNECTFFWHVHGKRSDIKVEPLKDEVTVRGFGPYTFAE